jgi:hypothetical protein
MLTFHFKYHRLRRDVGFVGTFLYKCIGVFISRIHKIAYMLI